MIINSPSIITTDKKKDVLPPDIYIVIKYNEKKDIMGKIFFLRSILKKNINHKIIGNNLTKKLPKIIQITSQNCVRSMGSHEIP
jgi:hypothetical protein